MANELENREIRCVRHNIDMVLNPRYSRPMYKCPECNNRIMICTCGTYMTQGSGYFATDYECNNCGKEYNSAGNTLVKRSQWGEETGEQFS